MADDLLKSISGSAVVTDMTGNIVQASDAAQRLFGYSKKELLALHIDDLIAERNGMLLAIQRELLAAMPAKGKSPVGPPQDMVALANKGREIHVEIQMTLVDQGRKRFVITGFRDCSREHELGQKLEEAERQAHALTVMSSDWYWRQDADLRFTYISGWGKHTHIADAQDVIGKKRSELSYVYESDALRVEHENTLSRHKPFQNLLIHHPGTGRHARVTGEPLFDEKGVFAGYHGVARDVTEEIRADHALRKSEARARALTALSHDWYWEQDADLKFTSMLGDSNDTELIERANAIGKTRFELPYVWESLEIRTEHEQALAGRKPFRDLLLHNPDNDRYALTAGEPIFDERGTFCGYHGVSQDVTTEKRAEKALRKSEDRFRKLTAMSSDWYWEQDENLRYTFMSASGRSSKTMPNEDFIGHTRFELGLVWESEAIKQQHAQILESRLPFRDLLLRNADSNRSVLTTGEPVFGQHGKFLGYQGVTIDVTKSKQAESEALRLATYDALTGLPNRTLLVDRLEHALAQASRSKQYVAVLFIDLDRFKTLNDTFGHSIGDEFLLAVSERLTGILRRSDTLARFGGDEFVVVLDSVHGKADAEALARKMLAVLSEPVELNGVPFQTTASIGVSLYPDNGADTDSLLRHADLAMYEAKDAGRGRVRFYAEEMNHRVVVRATLDRELRDAVDADQFELYFHPKHNILTDTIEGAEVLLRWNHPERGIVAPGNFIPAAEDSGLILPIGEFVLERTFATISGWLSKGIVPPRLSVNISSRQLQDDGSILNQARTLLSTSNVPRDLIEFEITESLLIQNGNDASINVLVALEKLGIRLAIDDFGTGYSSLNNLKRLPVNAIKIDRAFVTDITSNEESASIVRAVVGLAHNIKLEVICEGVETEEQLEILRGMGCDAFQGFLREEPMPQREFERRFLGLPDVENAGTLSGERTGTR